MQGPDTLPVVEFGGDGPSFHFAHANAYPPACYRQYLRPLTAHFRVWAMAQRPLWHGAAPAQFVSWRLLAGDLIRVLEQRGEKKVIGAGHSLGAVVSMMAAQERPELFAALILIEPVLLPPDVLQAARAYPQEAANMPLVQRARNRRDRWASRQQAFDRFRSKAVFERLTDDALWDYVNAGLVETEDGAMTLRFPREWEAQIYGHPPLDVWDMLPQIDVPTLAIRGEHSDTIRPQAWRRWQALQPEAEFVEIEASGHLLPLEKPAQLADVTRAFLERLARQGVDGLWKNCA